MKICNHTVSIITAGFMLAAGPAFAAQVDAVWNVGSGNWNAAANWLPAVVPNNGTSGNTYHVKIDNGAGANAVLALNQVATIDLLTVTAGDTLNFNNVQDLRIEIGPIVNDGLISINGSNSPTDLMLASSMSLNGSGILQLSNSANSRIYGVTGGPVQHLTHAATHTIRGGGLVGVNLMTMTNNGLIEASNASTMSLDLEAGANVNAGTIQAVGTGALNFNNTEINNTAGLFKALGTSHVRFSGSTINGGQLQADAGATFSGINATFRDITLTGLFQVFNVDDIHCEGTITNNGVFRLLGSNSATEFRVLDNGVTLAGPGIIEGLNNGNQNYIGDNGAATPPLLVNTATHTIRGQIRLGNNRIRLTNQGLIDSNAAPMTLDLAAGENVNDGTIQASAASTLNINDTVLENTDGLIKALGTSHVRFSGSTVNEGQLQADPGATFSGIAATFKNITLTGLLQVFNVDDIQCEGTITNNGAFRLLGSNSPTEFRILDSGVTLAGPGVIEGLNSASQNYISDNGAATPPLLVNTATHTIRGHMHLGNNRIRLTNQGMIDSNAAPMTLNLADGANINAATIQASAASTLNINDTVLDNTAGFIKALDTSNVRITNSTIDGGQLQAGTDTAFSGKDCLLRNITLTGLLRQFNVDDVIYEGTITNNGRIELNASNSPTEVIVPQTGVTFLGTGQIILGNNSNNFIDDSEVGPPPVFTNGPAHTIRGSGQVGNNAMQIVNQGSIIADQSVALTINPEDALGFQNTGVLSVTGVGSMSIAAGAFTTSGNVTIDATRTLTRTGPYTQTAGTTKVNGTLTASTGVQLQGGVLSGTGIVSGAGSLVTNAATIAPGDTIGTLSLNSGLAQTATGIVSVEIGGTTAGTQHDVLQVSGGLVLNGVLRVAFVNGFDPSIGQSFVVMTYPNTPLTTLGKFTHLDVPCNLIGRRIRVDITTTQVIVHIIDAGFLPGVDVNCDCGYSMVIDVQALILSMLDPAAFDALYPGCTGADVNGDGQRNGKDVQAFVTALLN